MHQQAPAATGGREGAAVSLCRYTPRLRRGERGT